MPPASPPLSTFLNALVDADFDLRRVRLATGLDALDLLTILRLPAVSQFLQDWSAAQAALDAHTASSGRSVARAHLQRVLEETADNIERRRAATTLLRACPVPPTSTVRGRSRCEAPAAIAPAEPAGVDAPNSPSRREGEGGWVASEAPSSLDTPPAAAAPVFDTTQDPGLQDPGPHTPPSHAPSPHPTSQVPLPTSDFALPTSPAPPLAA